MNNEIFYVDGIDIIQDVVDMSVYHFFVTVKKSFELLASVRIKFSVL